MKQGRTPDEEITRPERTAAAHGPPEDLGGPIDLGEEALAWWGHPDEGRAASLITELVAAPTGHACSPARTGHTDEARREAGACASDDDFDAFFSQLALAADPFEEPTARAEPATEVTRPCDAARARAMLEHERAFALGPKTPPTEEAEATTAMDRGALERVLLMDDMRHTLGRTER